MVSSVRCCCDTSVSCDFCYPTLWIVAEISKPPPVMEVSLPSCAILMCFN